MNPYLLRFIQGAPQVLRAVQGFGAKAAPKVVQAAVDTVTNPQTYRRLAASAENTLQRTLPKAFRDPGLRREFLKQFGGTTEKAARALSGTTNVGRVGGLLQSLSPGGVTGLRGSLALPGALGGAAWSVPDIIEASSWLGDRLSDVGIGYDPRRDPRVTPIQNRPVVNPGELAPDYSGAADRAARFAQYANMGQGLQDANLTPGATPPNQPAPPPPQLPAARGSVEQQAGQPSLPPPPGGMLGQVVLSNGAGVPAQRQNVQERALSQEVLNAAQQYAAPTGVPLPSFYAGQQQLGRSMAQTGELQRRLTDLGAAPDMQQEALKSWVRENPGLAYRELMKLQRGQ